MISTNFERVEAARMGPADPEVVELEARLRDAQLTSNVNALDAMISDDLLFTGPDGQLISKAADLAAHASGALRFREHEPEELLVRRLGTDVAVSAMRARLAIEIPAGLVQATMRYTRVWSREFDGVWRVVAGHVSMVSMR